MSLSNILAKEANTLPENSHDIDENNDINEPISNCSSEGENNEAPTQLIDFQEINDNEIPTFVTRMLNLCRELTIFCLIMITYAALTKDPPKISKAPAAYPFFPKDSIVTDWYRGQISKAIEHARSFDVAFVMFYAPWDAESQAARKEFETAARYMQEYITFAAVNCWQPKSECRNQYSKVYKWPVLIAYPSHGRGVQYNGPINAPHIIRFLQKLCNPILRLSNEKPMVFEDAYIIVKLNTSPGSIDFAVLYTTALKYLEKDPLQSISFYVHPQPVSEPSLHLHLWNETLIYPTVDRNWRPDEILQWIYESFHQVTTWIMPSGSKASSCRTAYKMGLPLFCSHQRIHCMLRQIITIWPQDNFSFESENMGQYLSCDQKTNQKDCNLLDNKISYFCNDLKGCIEFAPITVEDVEKVCEKNVMQVYKTSMLTGDSDPKSPANLLKLSQREKCRLFLTAQKLQPAIFEKQANNEKKDFNISGLACRSNKSLTLIAMDSLLYYHFAEKLGVDLSENVDKSAVVIINEKMESHYILKSPVNSITVREFIQNFTKNQLPRSLDSTSTLMMKDTQNFVPKNKIRDRTKIFIEELDTNSFLPTILQEKAIIVFYYSKQCSFCNGISYTLLTAAKKLSHVENLLFTRIDGDVNNLPWEYTMDSYPTILFFPANGKSESRVFPSNIPITVPNVVGFILTNLDSTIKLHAMWSICNQTKFKEERSLCFSTIQAETLTLIDQTLRDWRKSNKRQKQVLLHKLKQLRQLHLLFAHSPQKHQLTQSYFKKLNSKLSHSKDYHHSENGSCKDEL
ncbi:hypothetical protein NQ314_004345 [Rhamnusium bicolor]|uniref:Thioredoxin domain-containing protein n=1 Tax=Rhamnusium bicolor TaxID=1586634 RepID=A0AAV8ZJL9_9CUCU|nr:hypothetical protein NQ314_004345 [Rhamnusium bicolor]